MYATLRCLFLTYCCPHYHWALYHLRTLLYVCIYHFIVAHAWDGLTDLLCGRLNVDPARTRGYLVVICLRWTGYSCAVLPVDRLVYWRYQRLLYYVPHTFTAAAALPCICVCIFYCPCTHRACAFVRFAPCLHDTFTFSRAFAVFLPFRWRWHCAWWRTGTARGCVPLQFYSFPLHPHPSPGGVCGCVCVPLLPPGCPPCPAPTPAPASCPHPLVALPHSDCCLPPLPLPLVPPTFTPYPGTARYYIHLQPPSPHSPALPRPLPHPTFPVYSPLATVVWTYPLHLPYLLPVCPCPSAAPTPPRPPLPPPAPPAPLALPPPTRTPHHPTPPRTAERATPPQVCHILFGRRGDQCELVRSVVQFDQLSLFYLSIRSRAACVVL